MAAGEDWTRGEVEQAVASYLEMLRAELRGMQPGRKAHWGPLVGRLVGRSAILPWSAVPGSRI